MSLPPRKKYDGRARRLLLAFDIGTTFSGISYSILDPGEVPEIRPVTRFPSQEQVGGDSKIPTVIFYDKQGKPCATGAETLQDGIEEDAKESGWSQARWFKLHLRPKDNSLLGRWNAEPVPPLPPNKTLAQIFSDYMRYLFRCAREYIVDSHGESLWNSVEDGILYILTHPNGWGGPQQAEMRKFAIMASFVPDTEDGRSRINFVTEGEASLHFCLSNGLNIGGTTNNAGVCIVDAGGGTIDVTAYRRSSSVSFEEISIPKCYFQGAVFVTTRAEQHFKSLLAKTRFAPDIENLTRRFDRSTKHVFRKDDEPHHILFGSSRDRDLKLNIRGGRLTLKGTDVAKFFEPSIECIIEAIKTQRDTARFPITTVFLVGGFSASTWLFDNIRKRVEPLGISVCRPDSHVNKAVSNGAVSFHLDHVVKTRVSRSTYGLICRVPYDPTELTHRQRSHRVVMNDVSGHPMLDDGFDIILPKDTQIDETTEFRRPYYKSSVDRGVLARGVQAGSEIVSYTGALLKPEWQDEDPGQFPSTCVVRPGADLLGNIKGLWNSRTIRQYYQVEYEVIMLFGLTELKAQIAWTENGVEKRGPASVVYDAEQPSSHSLWT